MPKKSEQTASVKVKKTTLAQYRAWAEKSGRHISFLVDRALRRGLPASRTDEERKTA